MPTSQQAERHARPSKHADPKRTVEQSCARCGGRFKVRPDRRSQPHCSPACAARYGAANNRYNGGLSTTEDGRGLIVCRDGSLMLYARAVVAAHVGRLLTPSEIVHHVNENPSDDRIENLQIVTRAEHIEMHRDQLLAARGIYR